MPRAHFEKKQPWVFFFFWDPLEGRMLIVENPLDSNDVGLNKIGVRVLTQWSYTHGVCCSIPNARHGGDYDMLFDSEWSRASGKPQIVNLH
jgi:hypothetical protein